MHQELDNQINDDLRNFLFGPPGAGGLDLAAANIQRGRDHDLPGYNDAREAMGLSRIDSFDDPVFRDGVGDKLAQVYDHPDDIDMRVGGERQPLAMRWSRAEQCDHGRSVHASRDGDRLCRRHDTGSDPSVNENTCGHHRRNTDVQNIDDTAFNAVQPDISQEKTAPRLRGGDS